MSSLESDAAHALETIDLGEVVAASIASIAARPALLIGTAILCALPGAIWSNHGYEALEALATTQRPAHAGSDRLLHAFMMFARGVGIVCVCAFVGFVSGLGALVTQRREERASTLVSICLGRVPALTMLVLLVGSAALVGFACCFVIGPLALSHFALAPAVCVSQNVGPVRALALSAVLTKGNRLRMCALWLFVVLPKVVFWVVLVETLDPSWFDSPIVPVVVTALDAVTTAAMTLAGSVVFGEVYARFVPQPTPGNRDLASVFA